MPPLCQDAREEKVCLVSESEAQAPQRVYAEGEEFLEAMSLDRGAGMRPVDGGGSSCNGGPAVSRVCL